jgi:hypothetical protein
MKETGGPVLHEVVSGSDTSLRESNPPVRCLRHRQKY